MAETPPQKTRTIDRVRTAYYAARQRMEVPEWPDEDGNPLVICWTPITGHDIDQLQARQDGNTSDSSYLINIIILKAMDDNGQPHFQFGDREALLSSAEYPTLFRIAQRLQTRVTTPGDDLDTVKKNSSETSDSTLSAGSPPTTAGV